MLLALGNLNVNQIVTVTIHIDPLVNPLSLIQKYTTVLKSHSSVDVNKPDM